jgi:Domain of unknown function (DUF397).
MTTAWAKSSRCNSNACVKWRKSTYSTDSNCLKWRKSSFSADTANCVKFSPGDEVVHIGDTKLETATDPDGPYLTVSVDTWRSFIGGIKGGVFEL